MTDRAIVSEAPSAPRPGTNAEYFEVAEVTLPGAGLGGYALPEDVRFVIHRGEGARLEDADGNWRIDYVCGAGALILGHAHAGVVAAAQDQVAKGLHYFGILSDVAIALARELVDAIPCADKIVYATTGSEATFYALRMARAFTGKSKILKFEGAYHGNHDYSSVAFAPTALSNYPVGRPDSGGVPPGVAESVLVAPYNDLEVVRRIVAAHRDDLAAIIVEPIQRIISPRLEFLPGLRRICDDNGVVLIFDEVVTGFRLAYGGAQTYFGVTPDLAAYGKIVGGGGPLSCVAGRAELVDLCDPRNKGKADYAYVNGTLHGNPVAAAAGLATLSELKKPGVYRTLHGKMDDLIAACGKVLRRHGVPAIATGEASLWQILHLAEPPVSHADIMSSDQAASRELDLALMREGIHVLPNVRRFVSLAHTESDLERTVEALDSACRALAH